VQWPSGMSVASAWSMENMEAFGDAMGGEFAEKGCDMQFGPAVNIHRVPTGGRNFEYLSGEEPSFGYHMVQPVVRGIQSHNVMANV